MDRRRFLSLLGRTLPAGLALSAGGTYAVAFEPSWLEVRRVAVPVPGLDPGLAGLRIVQLSDLHRSLWVTDRFLGEAVDLALSLEPELVAITGDFITSDPELIGAVADELRPLASVAPVFAVPGNHDYVHFYPWARPDFPAGAMHLADALDRAGIRLLRNDSALVALRGGIPVEMVGLDDFWAPTYDAERAFAGASPAGARPARVVLSHNPDSFATIARQPFDLMLAGHTHGGQVRLPLLGSPMVPIEDHRFIAGLVPAEGRLVYVNRGLGFTRRIRFGVRPEITLLELQRA